MDNVDTNDTSSVGMNEYKPANFADTPLIHFADTRLTTPPPPFDFEHGGGVTPKALADGLFKKMLDMGGAGLAANQLGLPYRVFVFGREGEQYNIFNPQVIGVSSETTLMQEGCLSFPGFFLTIRRPTEVAAQYQTETGETVVAKFQGIGARIFLHEYDHMEGVTFLNYASKFKIDWELAKINKRVKKQQKQQKLQKRPNAKRNK